MADKTYHDDTEAPAHKAFTAEAVKKYGNDEALWPKDAADKEYDTRKRVGKKKSASKPTKKQSSKKRVARKKG